MHDTSNPVTATLAEEIKALLVLLLLKSGAAADEIELALRIAGGRNIFTGNADDGFFPAAQAAALNVTPQQTPKQTWRNDQLAPLQSYAA